MVNFIESLDRAVFQPVYCADGDGPLVEALVARGVETRSRASGRHHVPPAASPPRSPPPPPRPAQILENRRTACPFVSLEHGLDSGGLDAALFRSFCTFTIRIPWLSRI